MDEVSNILSNLINDNYNEKIFVVYKDGSISGGIYNVIDNHVDYDGDEFFNCLEQIELRYFDNIGVYIYRFKKKKLVDYKFIPVKSSNVYHGSDIGYVVIYNIYNLEPLNGNAKQLLKNNLQIDNIFNDENNNLDKTNLFYNGIEIKISREYSESKKHIYEDYKAIENVDMKEIIKDKFISWLKGEEFKDKDEDEIYNGLKITNIDYCYHLIIDKFSPTKETDYFGEFQFTFKSNSDYTKDMLAVSQMILLINNGKIVDVKGIDI